ncbi:MAG: flagellar export chaperone FliS [Gammaproteobacteria bacterium]|nr:flagellar export chaperone FliS [Gammaproteobacteria bacterium]MBI5615827.1 flagellar export chaperone FliS [Gammaproteobacteria bacterium]
MNLAQRDLLNRITAYRTVGVETDVESASPYKLIQMLLDGAVSKLRNAQAALARADVARKCENLDWSLAIIEGLKSSLDLEKGGEIAANLDALYEYMMRTLAVANLDHDGTKIEEVIGLLNEIRAAWAGIASAVEAAAPAPNP